jgi:ParB-like chromosome segregation protein Spo0J
MEVIYRKLSDIKPLDNNPRKITKEQLETLKKSISENPEYFEARPIILSDRTGELVIIAGNQRYRACKELKFKEVPTILLSGLTEAKEREIIIRDNVNNGGVLMSERMAAERMAAERMAAERMAAERYELSEREKEIVKILGEQSEHGKILR